VIEDKFGKIRALLELALDYSSADQTEASLMGERSALTRFANSSIHQNMVFENAVVRIRAVFGKKVASGTTNRIDEDGVRTLVDDVISMARLQDENPDFVSLPKPARPLPDVEGFYAATAESTPEQRAEAVRSVVEEADRVGGTAAGALSVRTYERAVKNTMGVDSCYMGTSAHLATVVTGPDGGFGYAHATSGNIADIDASALGAEASYRAYESRNPVGLKPGEYECILMPYAVADMLGALAWMGFSGKAYHEGRSFLCGKLGEKIVNEAVSIWDDGADKRTIVSPFDSEGIGKERVDLIRNGVANALLYDSYTAYKEGKEPTGHAPGGFSGNLIMAPGDADVEQMIANTKRGVLVTRFHYTNIAHLMTASFTGMTRDGTFLIEDGRIISPVKNLRFTQSIPEALQGTEMIGRDLKLDVSVLAPAIKMKKFRFSSATEF